MVVWGQAVAVNAGGKEEMRPHTLGSNYPQKPPRSFSHAETGATEVGCALLCHHSLDWVASPSLNKTPTDNLEFASSEAGAKLEGWEHTGKVTRTERSQSTVKWPARYLTIGA